GLARPLVFAVRGRVAGVGGDDRVHYGLVGPGVVVASETLVLSHDSNLLRRPEPRRAGVAVKGGVAGRMWRRHGPPAWAGRRQELHGRGAEGRGAAPKRTLGAAVATVEAWGR